MEKRAILAAILMVALLLVYQILFIPQQESKPTPQKSESPAPAPSPAPSGAGAPGPTPAPAAVPPLPAKGAPAVPDRIAVIETPLYRAEISSRGGEIRGWELNYRGKKPMVLSGVVTSSGLTVTRQGGEPSPIMFTLSSESLRLGPGTPEGELRLAGDDGFGLRIVQTLRFRSDSYLVEQDIRVENRHSVAQSATLTSTWTAPAVWPGEHEEFRGPRPISVVRLAPGSFWARRVWVKDAQKFSGPDRWIGFESGVAPTGQNGVYLTALIPRSPGIQVVEAPIANGNGAKDKTPKAAEIGLSATLPVLAPGKSWEGRVQSYLGPMEYDPLRSLGVGLEKAIYFGGFPFSESVALNYGLPTFPMEWIVVPTLALMRWFHGFIPNYGVAIILLTIITKVVFFPLTVKSMNSMKAMQALQPQINALRAKYKDDPQRMQQETMALYRQHKVNPLGGCLPMVVQIPIFYALYDALSISVDLQNAPFIHLGTLPKWFPGIGGECVWICDLAAKDPTYVLPILMGISMFIQQKMTPVMGDPRQAKMMLFMPVVFTFMFLNLPAGLVLYWTLSNVLQIAQQKYMERSAKVEKAPVRAGKKA